MSVVIVTSKFEISVAYKFSLLNKAKTIWIIVYTIPLVNKNMYLQRVRNRLYLPSEHSQAIYTSALHDFRDRLTTNCLS